MAKLSMKTLKPLNVIPDDVAVGPKQVGPKMPKRLPTKMKMPAPRMPSVAPRGVKNTSDFKTLMKTLGGK